MSAETALEVGDWRTRVACRGRGHLILATDELTQAIACTLCRTCSVRVECLAATLAEEGRAAYVFGTRAGLAPTRHRRLAARHGARGGEPRPGPRPSLDAEPVSEPGFAWRRHRSWAAAVW